MYTIFIESSYAGIAVLGGVSKMHPKTMKPRPIRKPSKVISFNRNVNKAVRPVAFMFHSYACK